MTNREDYIDVLQKLEDEIGDLPVQSDISTRTEYDPHDISDEFGSWIDAWIEAGLIEFEIPETPENAQITNRELFTELWRLSEYISSPPSARMMEQQGKYSSTPYKYRFGSWNEALEAAGFHPDEGPHGFGVYLSHRR